MLNYETLLFDECIEKIQYKKKINKKKYLKNGKFPIVSQEDQVISGFWNNTEDVYKIDKPVIIFGDHTRVLKYIDFDFVVGADGTKIIKTKPNIIPKYFYYFLFSANIKSLGYSRHYKLLKKLKLNLPPLPIQQKIVAKLDKIFAEIDKVIAVTDVNANNAEAMFDSLYSDYFNRKDILFKETNLGELCKTTQGIQISKSQQFKELKKNFIRYLYISDFKHDKNLKYIENIYPEKIVTNKDIVVVNTGASAGKIFKGINGCLSNNLFKVSHNKNLITEEFFFYFVNSVLFKKYQHSIMKGTANPHMGHENFKSTLIKIPNLDQQKIFISKLNSLKNNLDIIKNNYHLKIKKLNSLKQSILKQTFNGELVKAA